MEVKNLENCDACCDQLIQDETFVVKKGKEMYAFCYDCYKEMIDICVICEQDEILIEDFSTFEALKTADALPYTAPPGIFYIGSTSPKFIAELPRSETEIYRSGCICKKCAKAYEKAFKRIYRKETPTTEIEHTRQVILTHPDILRGLECDNQTSKASETCIVNAAPWLAIQKKYNLPDGIPTFSDSPIFVHRDVRLYKTYQDHTILALRPDPKYKTGENKWKFHVVTLPTYNKHLEAAIEQHADKTKALRAACIPAVIEAINVGILTQEGIVRQSCEVLDI